MLSKTIKLVDLLKKKHPWENSALYSKKFKYLKKKHKKFLNIISKILNNHHDLNFSKKFWEIIISQYLFAVIYMFYERKEILSNIKKYNKFRIVNNRPFIQKYEDLRTIEKLEFIQEYIHGEIIKYYYPNNVKKFFKYSLKSNRTRNSSSNYIKTFCVRIFFFLKSFLEYDNKKVCNIGDKNFFDKFKIFLYFNKFNFNYRINQKFKKNLRFNLSSIKSLSGNDKLLLSILIDLLPSNYLENFKFIFNTLNKKYSSTNTLLIEYLNDPLKILMARVNKDGGKVFITQHGGNYWTLKEHFLRDYEVKFSDYYFAWGTHSLLKNKICGFSKKKFNLCRGKIKENCLIYLPKLSNYHKSLDSSTIFNPDKFLENNFYPLIENLKKLEIKKNILVKMHYSDYKYAKLLKTKFGNKIIPFEKGNNIFNEPLKIIIHTSFGTAFIESIFNNKPSILILKNKNAYNSFTIKNLKILEKNNIVFNSSKLASTFIEKNWNDIETWWNDKKLIENRKIFLKYFALDNPKLVDQSLQLINNSN
tara:strand:+ start:9240 stop:10835 length:1596 start_codon:yes stop_codon:yes gene_type:complete